MSPNQQEEPPTISFSHFEPLPDDASPTQLRKHVWAFHHNFSANLATTSQSSYDILAILYLLKEFCT